MDRKLSEQRRWHGVGFVAPLRFGQELTRDLRGAQGDIADDLGRGSIADDVNARDAGSMALEPLIQ
jgi:hypothetical protein